MWGRFTQTETKTAWITSLQPGDSVEFRTGNSRYTFWVEYAGLSMGVAYGGRLTSPVRVRLTPEGTSSSEVPSHPLAVGERAQLEVLGPDGRALRRFLTSPLAAIVVRPRASAAA